MTPIEKQQSLVRRIERAIYKLEGQHMREVRELNRMTREPMLRGLSRAECPTVFQDEWERLQGEKK